MMKLSSQSLKQTYWVTETKWYKKDEDEDHDK